MSDVRHGRRGEGGPAKYRGAHLGARGRLAGAMAEWAEEGEGGSDGGRI